MVEWAAPSAGERALWCSGDVTVRATDWDPGGCAVGIPGSMDAAVSGTAAALRVPDRSLSLTGPGELDDGESSSLPPGKYVLTVDGVEVHLRFGRSALVSADGSVLAFEFTERADVAVGVRDESETPPTVTVPPTPAGVAEGLTALAASHDEPGPERSHPACRNHPPLLRFGERDVPRSVAAAPDTGIELRVPPAYDALFVAAPLAYYLGASVRVEDRRAPLLTAPAADLTYRFRPLPAFQDEVAALLRRTFHLDCLVRDLPFEPEGTAPTAAYDVDAAGLRALAPAERLAAYLDGSVVHARQRLPDWHLSTYVDPVRENALALPYLCDRLSLVYLPEYSELDGRELLTRALDDFYRGPAGAGTDRGEVASVNMLQPRLRAGHVHAWLADGTPIDAFKTSVRANENRLGYRPRRNERLDVQVVLNDPAMENERAVADIYRERAVDLPVDVTVRESLSTEELAAVFETPTDFVHYVGHCEVGGLKCADGFLSTSSLDASRARTFFLNACGSYYEGLELVERGSVAGGVTLTSVLNEQAATVGTAFARLLIHGFGIERALQLARRQIMMGKDYAVVGDGTYALTPRCGDPAVAWLEAADAVGDAATARRYDLTYEVVCSRTNGRRYSDPVGGRTRLYGESTAATLGRDELAGFLERHSLPVVFDGGFHWSDELAGGLRKTWAEGD